MRRAFVDLPASIFAVGSVMLAVWGASCEPATQNSNLSNNKTQNVQPKTSTGQPNYLEKHGPSDARGKWVENLNADLRSAGKKMQLSLEGIGHTTLRMAGEDVDDKMPLIFFSTEGLCKGLRLMRFKNVIFVFSRPAYDGAYSADMDVATNVRHN